MANLEDFLTQEQYKDENGHDTKASNVDCVTTYKHISDGFYDWRCAACSEKVSDRACGWPIAGQILKCPQCKKMNLILRNDTDWLTEMFKKVDRVEYLEERVRQLEQADATKLLVKVQELENKLRQIRQISQ